MTPGPTEVPDRIRKAMAKPIQNPDIDEDFFDFYHSLEEDFKDIYGVDHDVLILGGEGILGLEASTASTINEGDEVLCISNGIFGDGFADFVEMYGGEAVVLEFPYDEPIEKEKVKRSIEKHDFKVSTMVHCETPTGTLNDLESILKMLKENEILTIVDAVSSLGGTKVPTEYIDICIGGSQKCFSSPPGLTTLSVSEDAWEIVMKNEEEHLYTSLKVWKDMWLENDRFPYTHLVSNLYALDESIKMILEEGLKEVHKRHERVAEICRERGEEIGFELFPESEELCSPTVTAFHVEDKALELQKKMREEKDILLATSLGDLEDDILRIGHMGYNAKKEKVRRTMDALEDIVKG
ncbi:MAG: alanine--glyoxylate aminotransferase family protein [Candidatus Thermoplasmatota archaeon]